MIWMSISLTLVSTFVAIVLLFVRFFGIVAYSFPFYNCLPLHLASIRSLVVRRHFRSLDTELTVVTATTGIDSSSCMASPFATFAADAVLQPVSSISAISPASLANFISTLSSTVQSVSGAFLVTASEELSAGSNLGSQVEAVGGQCCVAASSEPSNVCKVDSNACHSRPAAPCSVCLRCCWPAAPFSYRSTSDWRKC